MTTVVELTTEETYPIRRSVLRDGTVSDVVAFDGDDEPDTFHLGVRAVDDVVAISTWMRRRYPDLPAHPAHQLRGMAILPGERGGGIGEALLAAGCERAAAAGSTVVWARARIVALHFYERFGFETRGAQYTDLTTGLAHHDIVAFI